jgi:hypothetical protein
MDSNPNATLDCVAAGALFIAMRNRGSDVTQKRFSRSANVSEITLRKWANSLGGYTPAANDVRDVATNDIGNDFSPQVNHSAGPIRDDEDAYAEDDAKDGRPSPAPPEQPERDDDDARDGHRRKNPRPRR